MLTSTIRVCCRTYNPEEGRGRKKPATQEQAMAELAEVGGWEPACVWVGGLRVGCLLVGVRANGWVVRVGKGQGLLACTCLQVCP